MIEVRISGRPADRGGVIPLWVADQAWYTIRHDAPMMQQYVEVKPRDMQGGNFLGADGFIAPKLCQYWANRICIVLVAGWYPGRSFG